MLFMHTYDLYTQIYGNGTWNKVENWNYSSLKAQYSINSLVLNKNNPILCDYDAYIKKHKQ